MSASWKGGFDSSKSKNVTPSDKKKNAYVLTKAQEALLQKAQKLPAQGIEFEIPVLFDSNRSSITATYYHSVRSKDADRPKEARMGGPFISSWLSPGDKLTLGIIGIELFAMKSLSTAISLIGAEVDREIAKKASDATILKLASMANGKPSKIISSTSDFVRNPYVASATLIRSKGKCAMPGCCRELFLKDNEQPYLEVHHVVPLSEDGEDTLGNSVALCPSCHRELHLGKNRCELRNKLLKL